MNIASPIPPVQVRVLGSGTSMGVPVITCTCPVCMSNDPHNKRLRASASVEASGKHLLIDCSIDFREQMLRWPMPRIDALFVTHTHSDHINGLDDIRMYNLRQRGPIPIFSTPYFLEDLQRRFHYCFNPLQKGGGVPKLDLHPVEPGRAFDFEGLEITPIEIMHGVLPILGWRIGRFAYLTDCSAISPRSMELLQGVDTMILSALRHKPHPTHFSLVQSLAAAQTLEVRRVYFTHINDDLDHRRTNELLPDWAKLSYDGQMIEAPYEG